MTEEAAGVMGRTADVLANFDRSSAELRAHVEQLSREREVRERFVAIMAHDLRGPLATAKLGTQLLEKSVATGAVRPDLVTRIVKNLDRMDGMLRDLLDVSRVNAGEPLPLRLEPCDLAAVARDVHGDLVGTFGPRFVLDSVNLVEGWWSSGDLRRALWNLGVNAARYGSPSEPVRIRVESGPNHARVSVHNHGKAIADEELRTLFDAYRRGAVSTPSEGAWGLGLSLVRACAEAHGGRAEVSSSAEEGTTFSILLPLDARPFQGNGRGHRGEGHGPSPARPAKRARDPRH